MPTDPGQLLRVASNIVRAGILDMLESRGEMTVGAINAEMPMTQSALSQHLRVMRHAHVVETRRESPAIYYRIVEDVALLELIEWRRRHLK